MRSPFSRLGGEAPPRIGHNQGPPLDAGQSWRTHCWRKARAELMPKLPIEVVRRRVARATELGLAYPAYASILMGSGRDIVGFLFTCRALGLRLERGEPVALAADRADMLARLIRVDRMLAAERPACELAALPLDAAYVVPAAAGRREGAAALGAIAAARGHPVAGVVMVGTEAHERGWADHARLAKFLSAESYFGAAPPR